MWYVKRVAKHPKPEAKDEEEMESLRQEVEMLARVATVEVGIEESAQDVMENEENEDEEEEEIVEPEGPKEPEPEAVKEEEMPPDNEDSKDTEPEKMDTSEPVETGIESETVAAAEKETEKHTEEGEKSPEELQESAEASTSNSEKEVKEESVEEPKESEESAKSLEKPEEEKPREASELLDDDRHRKRKKKEILVTWHSLNCPLPRITRKNAKLYLARLKEGFPFWETDDPVLNLGSLIGAVPQIGQLLLEDHEEKRHKIDKKGAEESMKVQFYCLATSIHRVFSQNILHALRDMSCLFVCFVEWMDCQPDTRPRTLLAITMQAALEKAATATEDPYHKKWQFVQSTLDHIFHEMVDRSPIPEVTCSAFSTARRFCPYVTRNEVTFHFDLTAQFVCFRNQIKWS